MSQLCSIAIAFAPGSLWSAARAGSLCSIPYGSIAFNMCREAPKSLLLLRLADIIKVADSLCAFADASLNPDSKTLIGNQ